MSESGGGAAVARQRQLVERALGEWQGEVAGRVVVVTGGARGIGRSLCEGLLRAGAKVVAADLTWDDADDFRKRLESAGSGMAVDMDITDEAALDAARDAVIDRFGTVDVLVNNASLVSETLFQFGEGSLGILDSVVQERSAKDLRLHHARSSERSRECKRMVDVGRGIRVLPALVAVFVRGEVGCIENGENAVIRS